MNRSYSLLFILIFVFCSCRNVGNKDSVIAKEPISVKTYTVVPASSLSRHSYMGEAVPVKSATVLAPYPGTLQSIEVEKGGMVEKGQVVAVVKSQAAQSALQIAQANLKQAEDAYRRVSSVYSSGSVTEAQMVEVQTLLTKAEASVESARKAVDDCSMKAPFKGVVSEIFPTTGVEILASQRIMTIVDLSEMNIRIAVHENWINAIHRGSAAFVEIPALGLDGIRACVTEKNIISSALTHSYSCILSLKDKVDGLRPGMLVKVRFKTDDDDNIVVPADAVQIDTKGKYVWLSESGTVVKRRIAVGGYSGMGVIVLDGLKEGEKVIVKGYQKVSGGMKVVE